MKLNTLQYVSFLLAYNSFNLKSSSLTKEDRVINADDRIIGGQEATPFFYNFIASIQYRGRHICGASLIGNEWILTAAHCTIRDASDFTVHLHRHNLFNSDATEGGIVGKVVKRIIHPEYSKENNVNDIALWKIQFPKTHLMKNVQKVEMDVGSHADRTGTMLRAIGWGNTVAQSQRSGLASDSARVLNEVEVPVVDFELCKQEYSVIHVELKQKYQVCAGFDQGAKDTCQGDSGGPLMYINGDTAVLVGITSFGKGCALPKFPGIYTRVAHYISFINSAMRDDTPDAEGAAMENAPASDETDMNQLSSEPMPPAPSEDVQPTAIPSSEEGQLQKFHTEKLLKNYF